MEISVYELPKQKDREDRDLVGNTNDKQFLKMFLVSSRSGTSQHQLQPMAKPASGSLIQGGHGDVFEKNLLLFE